jgi:hypothetical protein
MVVDTMMATIPPMMGTIIIAAIGGITTENTVEMGTMSIMEVEGVTAKYA